jgi:hypothetical protein
MLATYEANFAIDNFVMPVTAVDNGCAILHMGKFRLEAAMTTIVLSWAAIRARIAEWQHRCPDTDFGPTDFIFRDAKDRAQQVKWLM